MQISILNTPFKGISSDKKLESTNMLNIRHARNLGELSSTINRIKSSFNRKKIESSKFYRAISATPDKSGQKKEESVRIGSQKVDKVSLSPSDTQTYYRIADWKHPNLSTLKKNFHIIDSFQQNDYELEAAQSVILSFPDSPEKKKLLESLKVFRENLQDQIDTSYASLEKQAHDKVPAEFTKLIKHTNRLLHSLFDKENKKANVEGSLYVIPSNRFVIQPAVEFIYYFTITGLLNDVNYEVSEYYIVLTAAVGNNGTMKFYLNSLFDFKRPGSFSLGRDISDTLEKANFSRATLEIKSLLSYDKFHTTVANRVLPATNTEIKNSLRHLIQLNSKQEIALIKQGLVSDLDVEQNKYKASRLEISVKRDAAIKEIMNSNMIERNKKKEIEKAKALSVRNEEKLTKENEANVKRLNKNATDEIAKVQKGKGNPLHVTGIKAINDRLFIRFKPETHMEIIDTVVNNIISILFVKVNDRGRKHYNSFIRKHIGRNGNILIEIMLAQMPNSTKTTRKLTPDKLEMLREMLDLSTEELKSVRMALRHA